MKDDFALLKAIRRFDENALNELFEEFAPLMFRYAMRLTGNVEEADDIVGEVFQELLKQLGAGKGPKDNLRSYMYQIAYHKIVDLSHKAKRVADLNESMPLPVEESPSAQVEEDGRLAAVVEAMQNELTEIQRHVIALRFIEDLSLEDTARVIGRDVNNVKAIQHRGMTRLREVLENNFGREQ